MIRNAQYARDCDKVFAVYLFWGFQQVVPRAGGSHGGGPVEGRQ